jgi:23S rRNA (adenine2503-C2)-methyltransferase
MKNNIFGYTFEQIQQVCLEAGLERYRAEQIFYWLYNRRITDFEQCGNLPMSIRAELAQRFDIRHLLLMQRQHSDDGTVKYLFHLDDGGAIETVLIPSESNDGSAPRRLTLCVSTQVGCPLDCRFCATATMKLKRNLHAGEIVAQYTAVQDMTASRISNLVFMGMGEPLLNYNNVMNSVSILTHERTGGITAGRLTLSTAGMADAIKRMGDESRKIKLAISLHATTDELRLKLMPINKKYPLDRLIEAAEHYYRSTRMRVTWEYIMFDGLNDGDDDIRRLVRLVRRIPSKVNLIPFHPVEAAYSGLLPLDLAPSPAHRIDYFAAQLREANVTVMLRSSSGKDIAAACGQLAVRNPRLAELDTL